MSPRQALLLSRVRTNPETQLASTRRQQTNLLKRRETTATRRAFGLWLAAAAVVFVTAEVAFAGKSFTVRPVPVWVRQVETPAASSADGEERSGSLFLLDDHQTRVEGQKTERFCRHVKKVLSATGLEAESELQLVFEPSYQTLVIHHVRILRGGRVINALDPSEINVIQQESELDQRIYNGQLSAIVVLKDVRVGDQIDYAYTVAGDNPVMGGRFDDDFYLADAEPIRRLYRRLVWPTGRKLFMRPSNTEAQPLVSEARGVTEYLWGGENVAAVAYEEGAPAWYDPTPRVRLSEFENWGEVVRWALPLYQVREFSPELRDKIEEWRRVSDDPARRLVAALRFVQDEVRYLGIELGPYSHQPSQPSQVLARRFGDCKEKSLLLVTVLGALGIEAHTALVNSETGSGLADAPPSPYAFDHVIVRATLDGRTYWLDPTISNQRGTLDAYYPPSYGRALVLRAGSDALEKIPAPAESGPTVEVAERYTVAGDGRGAAFEVVTTYRGPDADEVRYSLSQRSTAELGKTSLNYYAGRDPSIRADGPVQVTDDVDANVLVVRERYTIPRFWLDGRRAFAADSIDSKLSVPGAAERTAPLAVAHPIHLRHVVEVRLPDTDDAPPDSGTITNAALTLSYNYARRGHTLRLEYTLRSLGDHIPAEQVTEYLEDLIRMRQAVGYELARAGEGTAADDTRSVMRPPTVFGQAFALMLMLAIVVALLLVLVVLGRRRRRGLSGDEVGREGVSLRGVAELRVGAGPSTAIRVRSEAELREHVGAWRSACGQAFQRAGERLNHEGLTYDGESLILVRLRCAACDDAREVYFVRPPQPIEEPASIPATS